MANRTSNNVYIIDTGSGNTPLPWLQGARISTIRAWFADTTGVAKFSGTNTADIFAILVPYNPSSPTGSQDWVDLSGMRLDEPLKIPLLTAATAWIYFQ